MMVAEPPDISSLFFDGGSSFGAHEIEELTQAVAANARDVRLQINELRDHIHAGNGSDRNHAMLGTALHFLASHEEALDWFNQVSGNGFADFMRGNVLCSLSRYEDAASAFQDAENSGYDTVQAILSRAGAIRMDDRIDEAEELLKENARNAVTRADYSFQMGCILSDRGDTYGAIEYFERSVDMDPHHSGALFRLAALNASFGNDEEAVQLYERALSKPPYFLGALMNLGLLYEDSERYDAAAFCFRRVMEFDPTSERARLYLKDIEAADAELFDEDAQRRTREMDQVLNTPITDFELSARSRNCLDRMGITTIGDMTRISEAELLASKNFGETSLKEVRIILDSRSLRIGENVADAKRSTPQQVRREDLSDEQRAIFDNPVGDLGLSVRARKCLSRLGILSIGELMNRSPDELLGVRNFGVTSLNEIRLKLGEMGVALRND